MKKIWLDSYEKGVSAEIDITQYNSVSDVFRQSVEKFADQPAFQNMGKTLTYAETGKLATDFASYLQNVLKLPRGERVAIMLPNVLQYPIALFGILQAGLVAVNTNPLYTPRELEHQLKDSGATAIIVLENFANTLELVLPRTQIKHVIVASVGEMFGLLKGSLINFIIRKIKKMVARIPYSGNHFLSDGIERGGEARFPTCRIKPRRYRAVAIHGRHDRCCQRGGAEPRQHLRQYASGKRMD